MATISGKDIVPVTDLETCDLRVDATYQGGRRGNASDDPLPRLLGLSTGGGFRWRGKLSENALDLAMLKTSMDDPDWPDSLDPETGIFTYFGDNKHPGRELHKTGRGGNQLLRQLFDNAHGGREGRKKVPPILLFASADEWRDVTFLGLAVPGLGSQASDEDLVAIWKVKDGKRFQNYRARFSVLDLQVIPRRWLSAIIEEKADRHEFAPTPWKQWVETGRCESLRATRSLEYRGRKEQLPSDDTGRAVIKAIHDCFSDRPHDFEHCAAAFVRMLIPDVTDLDVTRPSRDGGRDAVGQMRIGQGAGSILVDFAMEAKCYALTHSVGVKEVSRLISRLRHRQFGILVTSSYLDTYAYKEIKEDKHPIIVIAAADIVALLVRNGLSKAADVNIWLSANFPSR